MVTKSPKETEDATEAPFSASDEVMEPESGFVDNTVDRGLASAMELLPVLYNYDKGDFVDNSVGSVKISTADTPMASAVLWRVQQSLSESGVLYVKQEVAKANSDVISLFFKKTGDVKGYAKFGKRV